MNELIKKFAGEVEAVFYRAQPEVAALSLQEIADLEHRCRDFELHQDFTMRTGAHIVRAAAVMELERRKGK